MIRTSCVVSLLLVAAAPALAQSQKIGAPPEAQNMRLVGYNDLQERSAYQPTVHRQGDRYIAYIGHHGGTPDIPKPMNKMTGQAEFKGTSIVDVTDPAHPKKIREFGLPGQQPGSSGAIPADLHGPISTGPQGNRVYFGYGTNKGGVLQIVDRERLLNGPKDPTPENLRAPVVG